MRRSCCTEGRKQITLLSSVCLRAHFPLQSQQLIAYCEWQHFVFLNTGSRKAAVVSWILACLDFLQHADCHMGMFSMKNCMEHICRRSKIYSFACPINKAGVSLTYIYKSTSPHPPLQIMQQLCH